MIFDELKQNHYGLVLADPAWHFKLYNEVSGAASGKSAQSKYACMSLADIRALPVLGLCKPDAWLFLWATGPMLDQQIEIGKAWGFQYVTLTTWAKRTKGGKLNYGPGYVVRNRSDPLLIFKIGKPKFRHALESLFVGDMREHSRKPEVIYDICKWFVGTNQPCLDLFSRETRDGWDSFGDEQTKFNVAQPPC